MRKIFLTSGLVLCVVGSNVFAATDIDANGNVGGSGATCVYNVLDTYEGSSSFDAKWTPNNYTITFAKNTADVNGTALVAQNGTTATPSGTMSNQTYAYDSTANLTSNAYSITGYNFDGWSTTTNPANVNGGNATLTNAQSVTYTYPGNATLTAQWDPVKSGAITLISDVYPDNDTSQTPLYTTSTTEAVTPPTTSTVYSVYNNGLYSDSTYTTDVVAANLIPSKTGYTFGGYKNAAGTTLYINSSGAVQDVAKRAVTTGGGTDTWYANWTPKRYNVRYSTCANGSGTDHRDFEAIEYDGSYTILGLDAVNLLANDFIGTLRDITPPRGYHVSQWTDGTNNYAPGDIISQYTTDSVLLLTAVCAPNVHTITYGCGSAPNGASTSVSGTAPAAGSATVDSTYTLSATYGDCALTGYSATGWDCTGGAELTNATGTQSALTTDADIACTVHWTPKIKTITYGCGSAPTGASTTVSGSGPSNGSATYDSTYDLSATYGTCSLPGYNATGWDCSGGATLSNANGTQSALTNDADIACTVHWTPKTYQVTYTCGDAPNLTGLTITLDPNGSAPAATTGTYDTSTTLATNGGTCALVGDRGGYHFGGWMCDPSFSGGNGTTIVQSHLEQNSWVMTGSPGNWRVDSDVTCRVKWTGNDYTISYNHGTAGSRTTGFSGTMSDTTARFGLLATLTANAFSIPGYEFAGWSGDYNNSTGANTASAYTDNQRFYYLLPNNLSLTAQWTPKTKTITYSCGSAPAGASTTVSGSGPSNGSATYDSTYDLSSSYGTCVLPGYHATGWDCTGAATLTNATGTQSALSTDSDIACNVHWVANNIITNWDGNVGTIGTAGSDSCDYDGDITLPSSVTRPGFVLNGWTVTNSATLPSGYTKLEYIESTGTQYIDTGVSGFNDGNWEIYAKWMMTEWTEYGTLFAVFDSTQSNTYRVRLVTEAAPNYYNIAVNSRAGFSNNSLNMSNPINAIHTITLGNGSFTFDGVNYQASVSTGTALNSTTKMALFASTGGQNKSKSRIYSAWAKKNGVLQYNMIPARRNSDNVLGMYDTVSQTFKTNAGSGTFVAPSAQ